MKQTFLLLVLALGISSTNVNAQTKKQTPTKTVNSEITKTRKVGSDGYIWGDATASLPINYCNIKEYLPS